MRLDGSPTKDIELSSVIHALPGMVWTTRLDGRGDFVNRAWREYTGLSSQNALEFGWHAAIHPDDLPTFMESWSDIRQSGISKEIDARLRRFDGEYRWFVLRGAPFQEPESGNQHWCWLSSFADEAGATDGRMRRMFDILPWQAGFFHAPYALEFCNVQGFKDFDMSFEQLKRWRTSGHIHEGDHERNQNAATNLVATGQLFDEQIRMLYPDGTYRWMRARAVPVRDAQGNVVRYVSFQVDVDDLKRAEDLLAAEVKLLERVAKREALPEILDALSRQVEELCSGCFCGVLLFDPNHLCFQLAAGPDFADIFKEFHNGKQIDGAYDPCSLAVLDRRSIVVADLVGDSRLTESRWSSQAKAHGYKSFWAAPILSSAGEPSGVIAVYRQQAIGPRPKEQELTERFAKIAGIAIERARADDALNKARLELTHVARIATLNAMTASITHEVSQPISGILTNSNTCARMLEADPPNVKGAAETVRRTIRDADRAHEVIKRLRAMFAKKDPTIEVVDLNEAAREVIALSSAELRRSGAVLETNFGASLPAVSGDRVQLQQVILNMLLNAADAMSSIEGRARTLRIETRLHGSDSIELLIRDCGVGFDSHGIERLFEAFYTTKAHGLGIGLAISRSIIESHHGQLWATANEGPGATFGFCIPCPLAP